MAFYVIDRFEGSTAIVIADDGPTYEVSRGALPKGIKEGTVLEVAGARGVPDWSRAAINEAERVRRLAEARERLRRLAESDPGGDVRL